MDYLAGIDIGSTTLKAVIYDLAGNAVAHAARPTERFHPYPEHPDWAVWKPEQIWGGVCDALRQATAQLDNPADIKGVAVTGMGMDGLPIDADGNWLYPFISWHCPRTEPQHRWWMENIGPQRQFAIGGNQIWVFNTALRLLWMKENEPDILARTHKWLLIEDFVNYMLCGVCATDHSMASTTLLFDQRKRVWSDELIDAAGIDRRLLCDPLPSGTPIGTVHAAAAAATGLAEGTPVVLGGHDYCCGTLPVGAFEPGVVLDVTGTWEIVVCALDEPVLTPEVRRMGIPVHAHVASPRLWSIMAAAVAADMLEWFRGEFGFAEKHKAEKADGDDWALLMQEAAASPTGANGVMFLPHMSGSHCPVVDHRSLGAFVGLRNIVTEGDMLRAIIEGLDYQFLQIVNGLEVSLGVRPEKFVAIGGATRNAFWMQNKADMIGKPIEAPDIEEPTPLGAGILAGIGAGLYRDVRHAYDMVRRPGKIYTPDLNLTKKYRELFDTWQRLYPSLKDVNARIRGFST
ncbi:MAG TPA: FGGY family carbohydrate kinase [Anaerohalosphaeraceae bacterium]|jgi:xylulokinase|nr:FGGY family carbohydrate kinase [Anaerohalosphaeraceae bacterium]HRT49572.1 FGGY family carbohydrate kinase [Anaerohalosphaeraceae bacterium]HRT85493.1 FGGY family carbohydrate kinase [Anaerohalosphaeraceae bacterium]